MCYAACETRSQIAFTPVKSNHTEFTAHNQSLGTVTHMPPTPASFRNNLCPGISGRSQEVRLQKVRK